MAINDEGRQLAIAAELEEAARSLAHSTRDVPVPADSYAMLGELRATIDSLEEVCRRLGAWHTRVVDGVHYAGEDDRGDGATGTVADRKSTRLNSSHVAISYAVFCLKKKRH